MRAEFGEYQHGGIWSPDATLSLTDPNPTAEEIAAMAASVDPDMSKIIDIHIYILYLYACMKSRAALVDKVCC